MTVVFAGRDAATRKPGAKMALLFRSAVVVVGF